MNAAFSEHSEKDWMGEGSNLVPVAAHIAEGGEPEGHGKEP